MSFAARSVNLKTRCIMFFSFFSRMPCSELTSIKDFISSSVKETFEFFVLTLKGFSTSLEIFVKTKTRGASRISITEIKPLKKNAIGSGWWVAIVLGVISPKIKSSIVVTKVAIPTPAFPKRRIAM